MKIKNKKSQEEMVGFVLIIVLVAVIALVFLAMSARKPVESYENYKVQSFLDSAMHYSIDCNGEISIRELIKACYNVEMCGEKEACEVLKLEVNSMLDESFKAGKYKAYILNMNVENETILNVENGNCTGSKQGAFSIVNTISGNINVELEVCY